MRHQRTWGCISPSESGDANTKSEMHIHMREVHSHKFDADFSFLATFAFLSAV